METTAQTPDQLNQRISSLEANNEALQSELAVALEQIRYLKNKLFGRQTEKLEGLNPQLNLFDINDDEMAQDEAGEADDQKNKEPKKRSRRRGKRAPIPAHFPRKRVVHKLPDEQMQCDCGCIKVKIGEEISEQLELIPSQVYVRQDVREKVACPMCEGMDSCSEPVQIAPAPAKLLPKSLAGASLLAEVITAKFADGLPFHRLEKRFARLGLDLDRTTMANWAIKIAEQCQVLVEMLYRSALTTYFLQIDETTIQVMREVGRKNKTKSFMWVIRGGPPDNPIVLFFYHPTRQSAFAKKLLEGFQGYVQTDGYVGYDFLDHLEGIYHLMCWAHVRRKFADAVKALATSKKKKTSYAEKALEFIKALYAVERKAHAAGVNGADLIAWRTEKSKPILDAFKKWLDETKDKVPPRSLLGKAINYTLNHWAKLIVFLETDLVPLDNNGVENKIRPFVTGRKNWMLAGSPRGAVANAVFYSLVETAKANGWEPNAYLYFLFKGLPEAQTPEDLQNLLPTVAKPVSLLTLHDNADSDHLACA